MSCNQFSRIVFLFSVFLVVRAATTFDEHKVVETKYGAVRGLLNYTFFEETPFYSFKGIPFAKPPLGDLRFKAPQPLESWSPQIKDTFEYQLECAQIAGYLTTRNTSEDCLYLNVFIPAGIKNESLPVQIYMFGGGFIGGDPYALEPDFVLEKDIIFVNLNYRTDAFGFLSLDTPEYSGNMGLKDQQAAIKWVHENIEYFGGDKSRITLSGQSSGSMSTTLHLLNKESNVHFNQVLGFSGSGQNYLFHTNGNHRCLMNEFAKESNKTFENDDELIDFLKTVPTQQILNFSNKIHKKYPKIMNYVWLPTIESKKAIRPFLTEDPNEMLEKAHSINKTAYFTFTNREYWTFVALLGLNYTDAEVEQKYFEDFHVPIPVNGYDESLSTKSYLKPLMKEFYNYFFANKTTLAERLDERLKIDSDFEITYYVDKWVRRHVEISKKNTYYHRFSVYSTLNKYTDSAKYHFASHSDDMCFIFRCIAKTSVYEKMKNLNSSDADSVRDVEVQKAVITLYSNFIKYGKPDVDGSPVTNFKPATPSEFNFLDITNDALTMGTSPNDRRTKFYDYFSAKAVRLIAAHGDTPTGTNIEQFCEKFNSDN